MLTALVVVTCALAFGLVMAFSLPYPACFKSSLINSSLLIIPLNISACPFSKSVACELYKDSVYLNSTCPLVINLAKYCTVASYKSMAFSPNSEPNVG